MGNTVGSGVTQEQNFARGNDKATSPKFTSDVNFDDTYSFDNSQQRNEIEDPRNNENVKFVWRRTVDIIANDLNSSSFDSY